MGGFSGLPPTSLCRENRACLGQTAGGKELSAGQWWYSRRFQTPYQIGRDWGGNITGRGCVCTRYQSHQTPTGMPPHTHTHHIAHSQGTHPSPITSTPHTHSQSPLHLQVALSSPQTLHFLMHPVSFFSKIFQYLLISLPLPIVRP